MTVKEAIKRARTQAVKPYTELLSVSESTEYFFVEFTSKDRVEVTASETLFAVTKKTGDVWPVYLPDKRNFELLRQAKEVKL